MAVFSVMSNQGRTPYGFYRMGGLILSLFWLSTCSVPPRPPEITQRETGLPLYDYAEFRTTLSKIEQQSPDLSLYEISLGQAGGQKETWPLWGVSVRRAPETAPRILILSGIRGRERTAVESSVELLRRHLDYPQTWDRVNIDVLPLLDPIGWAYDRERPQLQQEALTAALNGKAGEDVYDLVIIHRQVKNQHGFSVTRYKGGRDYADFLISLLLDRGIEVQTHLPDVEIKQGASLIHGVIDPGKGNDHVSWEKVAKKMRAKHIYSLNVPVDEGDLTSLSLFLLANDSLIKMVGHP